MKTIEILLENREEGIKCPRCEQRLVRYKDDLFTCEDGCADGEEFLIQVKIADHMNYTSRAKLIDEDKYAYGYYARTLLKLTEVPFCLHDCRIFHVIMTGDGMYYHIKPETLEKFTGKLDKYANPIFGEE